MAQDTQRSSADLEFPSGWELDGSGKHVETRLKTKDFMAAVRLIDQIAEVAEELNHHPDVHLTDYNRLRIVTSSHDVGRLTERDVKLAGQLESLFEEQRVKKV